MAGPGLLIDSGGPVASCRLHPYIRGVTQQRKKKLWRVSILRARAQVVGAVEAHDSEAAKDAAVRAFNLNDEQRKRLAVREEE